MCQCTVVFEILIPKDPWDLWNRMRKRPVGVGGVLLRAVDYGSYKGPTDTFPVR